MTWSAEATAAGAALRQRREELGLSLEQAAAQLNLKAVVISQLESGQWDQQVAPTFIRGYLRHYVRLLKLDETEMLAQFDQQLADLPQAALLHSFSNKASRDAAESRFMLATYFLLVLLIGLSLVWFWQTHMLNEQPVALLPESEAVTAVAPRLTEKPALIINASDTTSAELPVAEAGLNADAATPGSETGPDTQPNTSAAPAAVTPAVPVAIQVDPSTRVDETVATTNSAQPGASPEVDAGRDSNSNVAAAVVNPAAVPANAAAATTAPQSQQDVVTVGVSDDTATVQLNLQFSAPCWLAVTDANGRRLAYSMQKGGQSLTLSGTPPLKVTFGDPTAVTASLSGKAIDLSGYKQGQVVRLTLTGSE